MMGGVVQVIGELKVPRAPFSADMTPTSVSRIDTRFISTLTMIKHLLKMNT